MRSPRLLFAAALALTLQSTAARAQDPHKEAADALFKEGRAAVLRGDYAIACTRFRDSDKLDPALGTKFNIADCEEHLGHVATAWALYNEIAPKFAPTDDRVQISKDHVSSLEKRLPKLVIRLAPEAAGATITRDGEALDPASLGVSVPLDPGAHKVIVSAPGREPRTYDVDAKEAAWIDITVAPGAAIKAAPTGTSLPTATLPTATATEDSAPLRRNLGFVSGGVGLVGIAIGAVTGILAIGDKDTVGKFCNAQTCTDQKGLDAARDGRTVSAVSTASFAIGAAALAAGVVLVLTSKSGAKSVVSPAAGPSGAGLWITRSF